MGDTTVRIDPEELAAHADRLRALARRLVRDPGLADDVVQEASLVALTRPRRAGVPLFAWLAGIVRNVVRHEGRAAARRERREAAVARRTSTCSTLDVVERAEFARVLVGELVRLAEPYRRTLLLRYFDGLEPSEIAARAGVPSATVRSHLRRGLELLRRRLDERHGGDRRRWLTACVPFVAGRPAGTTGAAATTAAGTATGVIAMATTKAVTAGAAALLLLGGIAWLASSSDEGEEGGQVRETTASVEAPRPRTRQRAQAASATSAAEAPADAASAQDMPPGRIVGRVVLPDGTPAEGAAVRLSSPRAPRWVETDSEGRFALDVTEAGDRAGVWVVMPGYCSPPFQPVALSHDTDVTVAEIRLEADAEVVVHGRLRSRAGLSVAGGRVSLMWAGSGVSAEALAESSDPGLYAMLQTSPITGATPAAVKHLRGLNSVAASDGRFELALPAALGRVWLYATAPGHVPAWTRTPLRLADAEDTDAEIELSPLPRATGQVVDAITGAPIEGAGVGYFSPEHEPPPSTTDAAGNFDVEAREGTGRSGLRVVADGYLVAAPGRSASEGPIRVEMWPARSVTGRVELQDGTPVTAAYVWARSTRSQGPAPRLEGSAYTDDEGRFVIERLTEATYDVTVSMGDRATTGFAERRLEAVRGGTSDMTIVVEAAREISGRVTDPAGGSIDGVLVYVRGAGGVIASQERSDARGEFVLRGLPGGNYTLYVEDVDAAAGGWLPLVQSEISDGTTGLTLVLRRGLSLSGVVVDDDGRPVLGRDVVAAPPDADPFRGPRLGPRAVTDGDGRFTLRGLEAGEVRLGIEPFPHDPRWWLVGGTRVPTGARDVRLVLTHGATIEGKLVDDAGAPVAGSRIDALWTPDASGGRHTYTDADGRFEIHWLPPDRTYTIASVHGRVSEIRAGTRNLLLSPQR